MRPALAHRGSHDSDGPVQTWAARAAAPPARGRGGLL